MGGLGDGGLVTVSARLRGMRDLGRSSLARYLHDGWGMRARLDEFTAAEWLLEFAELEVWNRRHRQIVACYSAALAHSVVCPPSLPLAAIMPTSITSCSLPR
jgi:dTDP-4-amino-4,6-dideoxygalactose transaminase